MPPIFIVPMPAMQPQQQQGAAASNAAPTGQPQIRRPPWIKDGPEPLPMPTAPWTLARARDRRISREEPPQNTEPAPVRKQSKITIIPSQPSAENGVTEAKVKQEVINAAAAKKQEPPQERKIDIQVQSTKKEEAPKQQNAAPRERKLDIQMESKQKKEEPPKERKVEIERKPSVDAAPANQRKSSTDVAPLQRKQSQTSIPPKPPAPPMPPPPPPAPGMDRKSLPPEKAAKIEALRSRPRKRPDWGAMMKEVESGRKLKHVECNDRSTPLLPKVKVKDTFMYESEKPNVHNRLLKEIQGGVQLKRVQCNDRSKPNLEADEEQVDRCSSSRPRNPSSCQSNGPKMTSLADTWSINEVRSVIRFLRLKRLPPAEIYRHLVEVYGPYVMSEKQVLNSCLAIDQGRADVFDEFC